MNEYHYHDSEPQPINTDLPHLRDGGEWRAANGTPKRRMEMYLGWLKKLGVVEGDAQCMMGDLYWDCFEELRAAGIIPSDNQPKP